MQLDLFPPAEGDTVTVIPSAEAGDAMRRLDPSRNMARFYALAVEGDLFGGVVLVRHWGRIGCPGVTRRDEYRCEPDALAALAKLGRVKRRKGYA